MIFCNLAKPLQMGFQTPATPIMEGIINLHHDIMMYIVFLAIFVGYILNSTIHTWNSKYIKYSQVFAHSTFLEIVWTIFPCIILLIIAIPSFALLYAMDEIIIPNVTYKIIGRQWYWSYEYADPTGASHSFDSYLIPDTELTAGQYRLLSVDNELYLPIETNIRLLITSGDVIHSWAIPSFGVKLDAIPGRLNQVFLYIKNPGVYYGQCSELCGVNHGFMPIVVNAVENNVDDLMTEWNLIMDLKNYVDPTATL